MIAERPTSHGVYYAREDYAGLGRRLLIDLVDFPVAAVLSALTLAALAILPPGLQGAPGLTLGVLVCVWVGYFVILKASRYRTVGYVVAGARIVNLRGERPSRMSLVLRLAFVLGGPMNVLFDVLWLTGDPYRQALRDKFAATYVIRRDAVPVGSGTVRLRTYTLSGMTFLFREVTRIGRAA